MTHEIRLRNGRTATFQAHPSGILLCDGLRDFTVQCFEHGSTVMGKPVMVPPGTETLGFQAICNAWFRAYLRNSMGRMAT